MLQISIKSNGRLETSESDSDIISEFLETLQDCQVVPSGDELLLYENYNKHGNDAIIKLWLKEVD